MHSRVKVPQRRLLFIGFLLAMSALRRISSYVSVLKALRCSLEGSWAAAHDMAGQVCELQASEVQCHGALAI